MTKKFKNVIAFTGAGISKASGIPTFEEMPEVKEVLTQDCLDAFPRQTIAALYKLREYANNSEPNDAHKALAEYKVPIITMNIDGLHKKAGSKKVYEIHGNIMENNVVLYGQKIHFYDDVLEFMTNIEKPCCFLAIGTSLKTMFSKELLNFALSSNMFVKRINADAEHEVRKFLEEFVKKP